MKSKSGKPLSEIRRSEPQPESAEIMETGESNGSVSNCTKETKMDTSKEPSIPDHMQGLLEQCTKGSFALEHKTTGGNQKVAS